MVCSRGIAGAALVGRPERDVSNRAGSPGGIGGPDGPGKDPWATLSDPHTTYKIRYTNFGRGAVKVAVTRRDDGSGTDATVRGAKDTTSEGAFDAGAQDLDRDLLARGLGVLLRFSDRVVNLCDRGGGNRRFVEAGEERVQWLAKLRFDGGARRRAGKGRQAVLKLR